MRESAPASGRVSLREQLRTPHKTAWEKGTVPGGFVRGSKAIPGENLKIRSQTMHLGNGAITPECGLFALGVAAASTGIAIFAARSKPLDRGTVFTAAALGAAVFAAQMFNVRIGPFSSVHLIGGVLLAWT